MVPTATVRAFHDELSKIAGELQGFTRIGRKPISIEKMLDRENQVTELPEEFVQSSMQKAAKALVKMGGGMKATTLAAIGAGGAAALYGRQAHEDHRRGRAMRKQDQAARAAQAAGY